MHELACHTHSPKAGQGMNVSMMDAYNLSWKLAHSLHGLTPRSTMSCSDPVLATFGLERHLVAQQLIDFDSKFSAMFSGRIAQVNSESSNLSHEQFLKVFSDGSGFTSGCGIEYPPSTLTQVMDVGKHNSILGCDYLQGTLKPGRRLRDTIVKRYADANFRHLHDGMCKGLVYCGYYALTKLLLEMLSTGRYRVLVFASTDLLRPSGSSASAVEKLCKQTIPYFPASMIELFVVHPIRSKRFEWTDLPDCLKDFAEMRFYGMSDENVYQIYGIAEHEGAIVVIRPDGYVGTVEALSASEEVDAYLKLCLVPAP